MAQVLLLRHAQDDPGTGLGLSPLGWEQGRMLGAALAARGVTPEVVVRGGGGRLRDTAEAVCEAGGWDTEPLVDPDWDEFDQYAVLDRHPAPFGDRSPNRDEFRSWLQTATDRWSSGEHDGDYAEPFAMFAARIDAALERVIAGAGERGTAVVVTAAGPIAWVAATLLADSRDAAACAAVWSRLSGVVVNSSLTKVVAGRRGSTLVTFNDHAHLESG
jgi:broad specificity phosphatase PhoE